jgi:hypothetical protein
MFPILFALQSPLQSGHDDYRDTAIARMVCLVRHCCQWQLAAPPLCHGHRSGKSRMFWSADKGDCCVCLRASHPLLDISTQLCHSPANPSATRRAVGTKLYGSMVKTTPSGCSCIAVGAVQFAARRPSFAAMAPPVRSSRTTIPRCTPFFRKCLRPVLYTRGATVLPTGTVVERPGR